jgi:NADH dehydrogenase
VQAGVSGIDLDRRIVYAEPVGCGEPHPISYDHIVLAVGGTTNTAAIPGGEHAMTFKSLADAIRLRNHTIQLFEQADAESDPRRKQRMLTFAIVGGGLVGTELAGEWIDFLHNLARSYPCIDRRTLRIELIQSGDRLMPEMDASLAEYARGVLASRGVRIRVNARVNRIDYDDTLCTATVHLAGGETIEACAVVATNGVRVNPVLEGLRLNKDRKGRILTDATMRSTTRPDVWALGDCAHVPSSDGSPYPQLAQHAMREGKLLAGNLLAALHGRPLMPFQYQTKGTLAALGHATGVGGVGRVKLRGFAAWWVWRTFYLLQMPRWNRRVRICFDWTISLFFKNDIVELDVQHDGKPTPTQPVPLASTASAVEVA